MARQKTWRCFHCDTVFHSRHYAAEHFGHDESDTPACKLTGSEGHLITHIRKLEGELRAYRNEDSDLMRAWMAKESEIREAIVRSEERGYDKGVQEAKAMFEAKGGAT